MKRKWMAAFLSCLMLLNLTACGSKEEAVPEHTEPAPQEDQAPSNPEESEVPGLEEPWDEEDLYRDLLEEYRTYILTGMEEDDLPGANGIFEACMGTEGEQALQNVGYMYRDLNEDGVRELIIYECFDDCINFGSGQYILAVYTLENEQPKFLIEGWSRNSLVLTEDDIIYEEGSSGAMYSSIAGYYLSPDNELECSFVYFTQEIEEGNYDEIGVYTIEGEDPDSAVSVLTDLTLDDLVNISEEYWAKTMAFEVETLADLDGHLEYPIHAHWANEEDWYDDETLGTFGEEACASPMFLHVMGYVQNLKLWELYSLDYEEELTFEKEEVLEIESVGKGEYLPLKLSMMGDLPEYALSFVDENGNERFFLLEISGMDGSPLLWEYGV